MAIEDNVGTAERAFIGAAIDLEIEVFEADGETPKNVSGMTFEYVQRKNVDDPISVLRKTMADGIAVVGAFNVNPDLNEQVVRVPLVAADSEDLKAGVYQAALWRVDAGYEHPVSHGSFTWRRAAATGANPP